MRCPNCNKFVAYDTDVEPEEDSAPEVNDQTFSAAYRRVLTCEECGDELKEATIEISYDFSGDTLDADGTCDRDKHEWEVESCEVEPTTDVISKDRHGRPIKSARYMKTTYGVHCDVKLTCSVEGCNAEASFERSEAEQASSFDELV